MVRAWRCIRPTVWSVAHWARSHLTAWIAGATVVSGAVVTFLAVLISLPDQPHGTVKTLIVVLIVSLVLSVVFPVAGQIVGKREQKAAMEHKQGELASLQAQARLEQIDRLLALGSSAGLPRLSEVSNELLGVTPTRYTIEGHDPYVPRHAADQESVICSVSLARHIRLSPCGEPPRQGNRERWQRLCVPHSMGTLLSLYCETRKRFLKSPALVLAAW